ncbi:hypothetical protein FNF28_02934 [Cafeteria roenbergensis]|uniref:NTP pyrophosphohydrolase MazG-like domain-containing protein n=2 Tax=Cafeteria roenbergensis TaxID=33653 RepID=A0A5A8DT84_CAFRO|nr:hypothetical protein FNF28_02934 [Cafeteria roenbergensis]
MASGTGSGVTLEGLRRLMEQFVAERDWGRFHTPRNVALALVGEVGEVAELFQWRGEMEPGAPGLSEADRTRLGEELSDVLVYLVRLADLCSVDLGAAAIRKVRINHLKYPADVVRGKAGKYTELAGAELFKRKQPLSIDEIDELEARRGQAGWWTRAVQSAAEEAPAHAADAVSRAASGSASEPSRKATPGPAPADAGAPVAAAEPQGVFQEGVLVGVLLTLLVVYGLGPAISAVSGLLPPSL